MSYYRDHDGNWVPYQSAGYPYTDPRSANPTARSAQSPPSNTSSMPPRPSGTSSPYNSGNAGEVATGLRSSLKVDPDGRGRAQAMENWREDINRFKTETVRSLQQKVARALAQGWKSAAEECTGRSVESVQESVLRNSATKFTEVFDETREKVYRVHLNPAEKSTPPRSVQLAPVTAVVRVTDRSVEVDVDYGIIVGGVNSTLRSSQQLGKAYARRR